MSTSATAVQRAFYAALAGNLAGVPVYDEPPETASLPYVTIGEAVETQRNAFGRTGRKVSATIHVWTRSGGDFSQGGFAQGLGIAGTIDALLDDAALDLSADGWADVSCDFQQSQTLRDPDGLTRHVVLTYEVLVEAA